MSRDSVQAGSVVILASVKRHALPCRATDMLPLLAEVGRTSRADICVCVCVSRCCRSFTGPPTQTGAAARHGAGHDMLRTGPLRMTRLSSAAKWSPVRAGAASDHADQPGRGSIGSRGDHGIGSRGSAGASGYDVHSTASAHKVLTFSPETNAALPRDECAELGRDARALGAAGSAAAPAPECECRRSY